MNFVPHNNLEEHLARFAANQRSRSVASAPQTNRKFTFRKISSLDQNHSSNNENSVAKSAKNWKQKSEASNASIRPPKTNDPPASLSKSVSNPQVSNSIKTSLSTKRQQQSIKSHFQSSQKQASSISKPCDSTPKSFILEDFNDFFDDDDLSDFDIPSTGVAKNNSENLPPKKTNLNDSTNKSNIKSPGDSNKNPLTYQPAEASKYPFELIDSKSNKSGVSLNTTSKFDNAAPVSPNYDDDDEDDIICLNARKKRPTFIFSDDESEKDEKGVKSAATEINKQAGESSFPILDNSVADAGFSSADLYLRNTLQSSGHEEFSPKFESSREQSIMTSPLEVPSYRNNASPALPARVIISPPQSSEMKVLNKYNDHPLLHKNHFQHEPSSALQSTLNSLKDLNFSVMSDICSALEKATSILSLNKHLESLIHVRSKILNQCNAVENAITSKPQPSIKSATVSPFYSKASPEVTESNPFKDKQLQKLHSTPLFHTAASQLRMNNNNMSLSGNGTSNFNTAISRPFSVVTPIARSSPDNSRGESLITLDDSKSLLVDDIDVDIEEFYNDDDVFAFDDGDVPTNETDGKTVMHDIYGNAPGNTQNSKDIDDKAICGKFYGKYRDDGASKQFKGMGFAHSEDMMNVFRNVFGLQKFRYNQLEAINAALLNKDCFILMPTGGGKSLCYQLPALITPGVTIVISPLRSLIMDQVQKLWSLDIPAHSLSGDVEASAANMVYRQLAMRTPEIRLLYVTPEKISASNKLISAIESLFTRKVLARFVIDEAHCVSQWGHDFRPDYKRLKVLRDKFREVPMIALTATATPTVRLDILQQLGMSDPKWFLQSFNRPNLKYEVRSKKNKSLVQDITELIKSKFRNMSGIIYCLSRNDCDNVAAQLCQNQIQAISYHAGLDNHSRNQVQEMWINDQYKVVCATIAFGMGIDKPDVRFVIHHTIPKSIEGYYQESGRAGRDGELSWCVLYYSYQDMHRIKRMIAGDETNKLTLSTHFSNLFKMVHFCENTTDCRRVQVLEYFGEKFDKQLCSKYPRAECDNCFSKDVFEICDVTEDAKAIVQCMSNIAGHGGQKNYTLTYLVDIFKGAKTQKIIAANHTTLQLHGKGSKYKRSDAERLLRKLVLEQFLQENLVINRFTDLPCSYVYLGRRANELLQGKVKVHFPMKKDSKNRNSLQVVTEQEDEEMKQLAERCYTELIEVSKAIAADRHMHYTNVVNVEALRQMSREMPMTEREMLLIPHVTRAIYDKYGQRFLEVTQRYKAEKCVIEAERADKQMLSAFVEDDNDSWSNPPSPAAASGKTSYGRSGFKRKRSTKGAAAKRNKKFYQPKSGQAKWKKNKEQKGKSQSFSNGSFKSKAFNGSFKSKGSNGSFKAKTSKGSFPSSTTGRVPGFLPVPKPQGKPSSRSFLPPPRVTSTF